MAAKFAIIPATTIATVVLARWLGPVDFGVYAAALAVATAANAFSYAGLDQAYLRNVVGDQGLRRGLLAWQVIFLFIATVSVLAYPPLDGEGKVSALLIAFGLAMTSLALPFTARPQRQLQYAVKARRDILLRLIAVAPLLVVPLVASPNAVAAAGAFLLGGFAALLISLRPRTSAEVASNEPRLKLIALFRDSVPFGLQSALIALSRQAPMICAGLVASVTLAGSARAALSIYGISGLLAVAMNNDVLRPRLYARASGWARILRVSFAVNVAAGSLVALAVWFAAPQIVSALFGQDFEAAAEILALVILGTPFFFVSNWFDTLLVASGRRFSIVARLAVSLAIVVGTMLSLGSTPRGIGAAVLAAEIASLILVLPAGVSAWRAVVRIKESPDEKVQP
ncbi:lipopolysaccharide biosynthesis protein [Blastococcus sp. LR1]|uniref:lipopolysaccharide biosynthesis protein n=1 Tax=Blastococcus sp. LR1 TaxID=2877000 RepID=UPI001CCAC92B|nr:lipopolysaccharide biosynthesis protein [Blastococcus sp. LR1]MCA0144890.1 lipopolysaccharide biosynthesis protein [Blastococcus sp. LR1]